ncbi:MAG: hypothetical protein ACXAC7_09545 [Candidatus Hodarchaeales archaeon]|jgi:hypothetical protein
MNYEAIFILNADSGMNLYSRTSKNIQEDLFSAFLSALKSFFTDFALGGLSSFSTEDYNVYLASNHNILTSILVKKNIPSDKYYSMAYEISDSFYTKFQKQILKTEPLVVADCFKTEFEPILDTIIENYEIKTVKKQNIFQLYTIESDGDLMSVDFENQDQLYSHQIIIIVNKIIKIIYILEMDENVSNRLLFLANREISNLNQREFKSEFKIRNISEQIDCERLIDEVSNIILEKAKKSISLIKS